MNSHQLYNRYKELDKDLIEAFRELTEGKEITFADDDYWENIDELPEADWVDKHGNVRQGVITAIKENKVVIEDQHEEETVKINFQDINDIYYKLKLIEDIEQHNSAEEKL